MKGFGNSYSHGPGPKCPTDEGKQVCIALCNLSFTQEGINIHPFAPLLSFMYYEELWCKVLERIMHDVPPPKDVLLLTHLDSCGFKGLIGEIPFLEDLQRVTSQTPMRCKEGYLLWEIGSLH